MHRSAERSAIETGGELTPSTQGPVVGDTIAAISTPVGEGAIAVVRLSGADAIDVADEIFAGRAKPSTFQSQVQHLGELRDPSGELIDQVVLSVHRAPASYTGEDVVEISCHGGTVVTARVLEACLQAGARPARAGEFTERAFLNGKMDLTQAEAVIDLIRAKTDLARRSAIDQLEGKLGQEINGIRDDLISLVAQLEASIDFPDEGIVPEDENKLQQRLALIQDRISTLIATSRHGRVLREGLRVVIYGPTNAGKSSLLNRLLGYERVIVSERHGTTRDVIEETMSLRGLPVRLLDTAGLRESEDSLEREGIARTEKSLQTADLRLHIVDRSSAKPASFQINADDAAELVVLNKCDLPEHPDWRRMSGSRISCLTGEGLADLEAAIVARVEQDRLHPENTVAINTRHRDCLRRALEACQRAQERWKEGLSVEYVGLELNDALKAIGEVLGLVDVERILDSVFSQFCIGK